MGVWDRLTSQFIEIIEWLDDSHDTLAWRFPVKGQEIKNGAKLVVREGQAAVFVNEGKLADVFAPGTYTLSTQNLPILATLQGWKYGFNSPFKAEVYFVCTTQITDRKWGTQNPIMIRDPEFGPLRLRAFGSFSIQVADPAKFLRQVAGTDSNFQMEEIEGQLKRNLVSRFTQVLGEAKIPALDLAGNYDALSAKLSPSIAVDFEQLGIRLSKFFVENISLPPEVEQVLDTRSKMSILGNPQQYAAYQMANAIPDAARNPNSAAGAGMGLAAGMAMGSQMANSFFGPGAASQAPAAAYGMPVPGVPGAVMGAGVPPAGAGAPAGQSEAAPMIERLKKLDALKAAGVLTDEEYAKKRAEILSEI